MADDYGTTADTPDDDLEDDELEDDGKPSYNHKSESDDSEREEHQLALERLQIAAEALYRQIEREKDDLRYQVPDLMWSADAKSWRAGEDLGGGIIMPDRPMIAIPKIEQAVRLVLNQERSAHLGVSVHPENDEATEDDAETITGLYRQVDRESRAGLARSWGFNRAVKAGRGCWRILTEPALDYARTKDQNIRIKRVLYQEAWFPDPFAQEPDQSDREYDFLLEWVPWRTYQKIYGKKGSKDAAGKAVDIPSKLAVLNDSDLTKLSETAPAWIRGEGEARAVLIAEYLYIERRPESRKQARAEGWLEGEERRVCSRWMNAVEFMNRQTVHCSYIPIVPVIGEELIPFDDERRWQGIYGPNKGAQDSFNYAASAAIETMAQEPRSTWIIAEGQEVGHERELLLANIKNFPYVRYKPTALEGNIVPGPQRSQADTSKLGLAMQMLTLANDWVHAGTNFYEPSLGRQTPNVRTKGATLALQQQGDTANSHWLDNLSEVSMQYEARCFLSMVPYYYDRPGRIARILGHDKKESEPVVLNRPYTVQGQKAQPLPFGSPEEKRAALDAVADPQNPAKLHNLRGGGLYGFTISVGKGYKGRLDEGAGELGQLFQAEPELFRILGDIYLRFRDFPGHMEAADRLKRMLPPQARDPKDQGDPAQQLQQAQQMLQMMQEKLKELEPEKMKAETARQIASYKADVDKAKIAADVELQKMKDATTIAVAQINAIAKGAQMDSEAQNEAIALARDHAADATEADKQRAHEVATAAAQAGAQAGAAEDDHSRALEAGEADHQRAVEQGAAAGDEGRLAQSEAAAQAEASAQSADERAAAAPADGE